MTETAGRPRRAATLATGDELVTGRITDTNSPWILRRLRQAGLVPHAASVVGDDPETLVARLVAMGDTVEVLLVTGGLGPTEDDRTREALAVAARTELLHSAEAWQDVEAFFARFGRTPSPSNRRQALVPAGATLLRNERGTAPGIRMTLGRATVFALPGVPSEMRWMVDRYVEPWVRAQGFGPAFVDRVHYVHGVGESLVGEAVARWMEPDQQPRLSITAAPDRVCLTLSDVDDDAGRSRLEGRIREVTEALAPVAPVDPRDDLAAIVVDALGERGETLALAESCTGGLLGAAVTAVPGASRVFIEGCVTYADEAKVRTLGVDAALLASDGAVSESVARAMAEGVRARAGTTWGLGITGIAGPGGGDEEKPVGLVHLALAGPDPRQRPKGAGTSADHTVTVHRRMLFPGSRDTVRRRTVVTALSMLREAATWLPGQGSNLD